MTRLRRQRSRAGQLGCSLAIVVILGTLSYILIRFAENWLMYVVGGGFGFVAAAVFLSGFVHQLFALRTPESILEMDGEALTPGRAATLRVRQLGNARFESLRVNLAGEEQLRSRRTWNRSIFEKMTVFDSGPFAGPLDQTIHFEVPPHYEPTGSELRRRVRWTLEIWGKVQGRPDVQHVYDVFLQKP